MNAPSRVCRATPALAALAALAACAPPAAGPDGGDDVAPVRTQFAWRSVDVDLAPSWGGFVAEREDGSALHVGGMAGGFGPVVDAVHALAPAADGVDVQDAPAIEPERYCGCAMIDEGRGELIVIGGRDGDFQDATSAVVVDLDTSDRTAVEHGGAADAPVGCHAVFLPDVDRGYVFGGLSSTAGTFSSTTYRWDPTARTFTALPAEGPAGRYDAGLKRIDGGSALLASGMGRGLLGAVFYDDVWRFDGATEAWTEIVATTDAPPGRRWPFFSRGPDDDTWILGYGSDSGRGESVKDDLWRFSLATGAWTAIDVEGDAPSARGFAAWLPGPANSAGLLAGGFDGTDLVDDAWVLDPPDDLSGTWR